MSSIPPGLIGRQDFYLSGPMPCPYLPGRVERKLFTALTGDPAANAELNALLTRAGFRRSHEVVYRPACESCRACIAVRVPVARFALSRGQKRVAARNRDLGFAPVDPLAGDLYPLFIAYQRGRHTDGDMAHMSRDEFIHMLRDGEAATKLYGLRRADGDLLGAIIVDEVGDGASAVYSFFAPEEEHRSLGTQLVLSLIAEVASRGQDYVYLGYWIAASRKMAYKARFRPLQILGPQGWQDHGEDDNLAP